MQKWRTMRKWFRILHKSTGNVCNIWSGALLKIARPDSLQNFMDTPKTICFARLCIQITKLNSSLIHIHTSTYKENQIKKHVNSKPKVLSVSNTMFRMSWFRTTDIHRRTDGLGQLLCIKIVFPNQLTMLARILFKIF